MNSPTFEDSSLSLSDASLSNSPKHYAHKKSQKKKKAPQKKPVPSSHKSHHKNKPSKNSAPKAEKNEKLEKSSSQLKKEAEKPEKSNSQLKKEAEKAAIVVEKPPPPPPPPKEEEEEGETNDDDELPIKVPPQVEPKLSRSLVAANENSNNNMSSSKKRLNLSASALPKHKHHDRHELEKPMPTNKRAGRFDSSEEGSLTNTESNGNESGPESRSYRHSRSYTRKDSSSHRLEPHEQKMSSHPRKASKYGPESDYRDEKFAENYDNAGLNNKNYYNSGLGNENRLIQRLIQCITY